MTGLISLAEAALRVSEAPSAFPSTSASPTEHGTPFYHGPDDIPIDPALHGPPVDPALLVPSVEMSNGVEVSAVVTVVGVDAGTRTRTLTRDADK